MNNNNFVKAGRLVAVVWTIGNDFVDLAVNCCVVLVQDFDVSIVLLLIVSLSVFDEFSSSDETIKSSSDDDRENDELSWSDSMRIGSNISLVFVGGI